LKLDYLKILKPVHEPRSRDGAIKNETLVPSALLHVLERGAEKTAQDVMVLLYDFERTSIVPVRCYGFILEI